MKLIIQRNLKVDILERSYEVEKEEVYENVQNLYIEGKKKIVYKENGERELATLILFNDNDHKGALNINHLYLYDCDTLEVK